MRLNAANRAFLALVALSLLAYAALGAAALALVSLIAYRAVSGQTEALLAGHDLRPAVAFLAPVGLGALLGWRSLRRQTGATRDLAARVGELRVPQPPDVVLAARRVGMSRRRVDVVRAAEPFSFAYGLVAPRVVVSTGLVDAVSREELDAVLEHERYHVRNLDPLKVLLARVLPSALFFLPALHDLRKRYAAGREIAADRRALEIHGRRALAGALLKVVRGPGWSELGAAAAIGGTDLLDVRVAQLETGQEPDAPRMSLALAAASTVVVAVLAWSFASALGDLGTGAAGFAFRAFPSFGVPESPFSGAAQAMKLGFWVWIAVLTCKGIRRRSSRA